MAIKYKKIESSNIEGVSFNREEKKYYIKFKNGREYVYENVGIEEVDQIESVEGSKSSIIRKLIINRKKFEEIW